MLTIKEKGILEHIITHSGRILAKAQGKKKEDLLNNDDLREIICFNILQIGELVKHLDNTFLERNDKMAWKDIKGMRDIVAHGYDRINIDRVWNTVQKDIPELKEYAKILLIENK